MAALDMWLECPRQGRVLRGFVAHKVPIDEVTSDVLGVDEGSRYSASMLIERQLHAKAPLGLAISLLTAPPRVQGVESPPAREEEWEDWDVQFACVPCAVPLALERSGGCPGPVTYTEQLPPPALVEQFVQTCVAFWAVAPGADAGDAGVVSEETSTNHMRCIAVHCNTGFNLTGYLICHFLVVSRHVTAATALAAFAAARPPGIYDRVFIEALFRFHRQAVPAPSTLRPGAWTPPSDWPAWHAKLRDARQAGALAAASAAACAPGAVSARSGLTRTSGPSPSGADDAACTPNTVPGMGSGAVPAVLAKAANQEGAPRPPVPMFAAMPSPVLAGGKRPREEGGGGDAVAPLPRLHALRQDTAGIRPFGTPLAGEERARARRRCMELLGLPVPADSVAVAASSSGGARDTPPRTPLGFPWAKAAPLSSLALTSHLSKRPDAYFVSWAPCGADDIALSAAVGTSDAASASPASGAIPCVLLWTGRKAALLTEQPIVVAGMQVAPDAAQASDVWLLEKLNLHATEDPAIALCLLLRPEPPQAVPGKPVRQWRWRLYVRDLLRLGERRLCNDPFERRLGAIDRHVLAPHASLAPEQRAMEPVSLAKCDFFKCKHTHFVLTQTIPAMRKDHPVLGIAFYDRTAPYALDSAEQSSGAVSTVYKWPDSEAVRTSSVAEYATADALRACAWLHRAEDASAAAGRTGALPAR